MLLAIATVSIIASCNVNYEKTSSGMQYKLHKGKGGELVKAGEFVKINIEYKLDRKDSLLNSSYGKVPVFTAVDTSERSKYSFMELLTKCNVGDSMEFVLSIDSLKNKGMIPDYNAVFQKGGTIKGRLQVLAAYKTEALVTAAYQKEMEEVKNKEVAALEAYLKEKGIKAQKTKNGAFVVLTNPGDQTNKADSGKEASVLYRGSLKSNGKVFDTNMDTTKGPLNPYKVIVGRSSVIQGWHDALPYFGKGGIGVVYIPSSLAYGGQQQGPDIAPYSDLVFDMQVVDVKPAPAAPQNAQVMMPVAPNR